MLARHADAQGTVPNLRRVWEHRRQALPRENCLHVALGLAVEDCVAGLLGLPPALALVLGE